MATTKKDAETPFKDVSEHDRSATVPLENVPRQQRAVQSYPSAERPLDVVNPDHSEEEILSEDKTLEDDQEDNNIENDLSLDMSQSARSTRDERVLYYEVIPDLRDRGKGCIYRLFTQVFDVCRPPYNPYEWLEFQNDFVDFHIKSQVQLGPRDSGFWVGKRIYIDHPKLVGYYTLKHNLLWEDEDSRAHCFERAQSHRFGEMMLSAFRKSILIHQRRKERKRGKENDMHRQLYSDSLSMKIPSLYVMQTACRLFDQDPQWILCEGQTAPEITRTEAQTTHRYIWEYDFHSLPSVKQTWTEHIFAWVHYTYEVTGQQSLITSLECDVHGQITNLVVYTKGKPPRYDESAEMVARIDRSFIHFREQHACNMICKHLGLTKFRMQMGKSGDFTEIMCLNSSQ
ncbi:uncharacterized protein MELLADRAFT_103288 [Melampsora larici-populina 98AG31]|uniref:Alpha-type protein kinase domain-containing protein n=1 Tax=Melampsora larici-populina (strain 98AG31 / pathotype 3-4-7) TaxID=747676 RepID=F4R9X5_MELLP|nr:uncharacterized protein MELLADRAFT_103288 [Melampsora larici-populina 98AG31]EGG10605.1 hypothetical protein MELLADRAFT_103288 [Melampsora larici-populina 98AG31]